MEFIQAKCYTKGRQDKKISQIVIHWWGDPAANPTHDGVVGWFRSGGGNNSAHYVVSAGRVTQMVADEDTAWHAGNWDTNLTSIGIEISPYATEADKVEAGALINRLYAKYGRLPLKGHKEVSNRPTACPGVYDDPERVLGPYVKEKTTQGENIMATMSSPAVGRVSSEYGWRPRLSARIGAMLHAGIDIANRTGTPVHAAYAGTVEKASWNIVAGRTGQGILIRNPDGERQYYGHLSAIQVRPGQKVAVGQQIGLMGATGQVTGPHLHFECWDRRGKMRNPREDFRAHGVRPGAEPVIPAKAPAPSQIAPGDLNRDGKISYYEYEIDGIAGEETVKGVQRVLHDRGCYSRANDGQTGYYTWLGWQKWLRSRGFYPTSRFALDGELGYWTVYETQRYFQSLGEYRGFVVDGRAGRETVKALQRVLATTRRSK